MDMGKIRAASLKKARRLGYATNPELPLLDADLRARPQDQVVRRCLARFVTVAVAYGFDRGAAWRWLEREGLAEDLAPSEREFLEADDGDGPTAGVESLWAMCWALGMERTLDFGDYCGDHLVELFPDIKQDAIAGPFVARSRLRKVKELAQALDLAYCVHWSLVEASLRGGRLPGPVEPYVVIERRHALEWILGEDDWDDVSLDT